MELIDLKNFAIIFLPQATSLIWLSVLFKSLMVILSLALILRPEFVLPWLCLHWETLIMLLSQIPLTFFQTKKGIIPFIARTLQLLLCWLGDFTIIWEIFHWMIPLKSVLLQLILNFVRINVYFSQHKYQVKPHPSLQLFQQLVLLP